MRNSGRTRGRKQAERLGRLAEFAAACLMRCKGYRVIDRRVRTPVGEIDLIVGRGNSTAFVEVKARASHDEAVSAIAPRQAERIVAAARAWLARNPERLEGECRFDIVTVNQYLWPSHLPNAFGEGIW